MTNSNTLMRSMVVYAICLPLAIFLGYLLTDPFDRTTTIFVGIGALLLAMPLFLRWYHPMLVVFWNMPITFLFLHSLPVWIPIACVCFSVAIGHYILNRNRAFLNVPSVAWPLVLLALVVAVTAKFRGGIGLQALGDESIGGKRYIWIWAAVIGYFALVSQQIPVAKRKLYATIFLITAATPAISDLASLLGGPVADVVSIFFPRGENAAPEVYGQDQIERFGGIATACVAVIVTMMARYGLQGILNLRKFWRPCLFFGLLCLSAFGGFRSVLILILMTVSLMFCFEGLLRSRLMPIAVLGFILMGGIVVAFSDQLPLPVQRCLAFLPVKIDPIARLSAEASTDWRLEMWSDLMPLIPRYFFLGKGLTFESNDLDLYITMGQNQVGGMTGGGLALSSDYHNGPLSLIIPFGIFGVITFLWFVGASLRVLWLNHKYGSPDIRFANVLLLSYFIAKLLMFLIIFGGFYADLSGFVGLTAFSIALNAGVCRPVAGPVRRPVAFNRFRNLPIGRPMTNS